MCMENSLFSKKEQLIKQVEIGVTDLLILVVSFLIYQFYQNGSGILWVSGILLLVNTLRFWFEKQIKEGLDWIIRYRYLVALICFSILVMLRIHGSSIGIYDVLFGKTDAAIVNEIFGNGRIIRGDEFNVQVPYFFSQWYNQGALLSDYMSLSPQNMIIGYNAPVWDLTLIGKPFIWGYLLFGNEIGLSWYWCSKIILFLLVGYEMMFILTKRKYLSLFSSICIVFSPLLQWWLAPHMYQVFFWASSLFVVGYYFFMAKKKWLKILSTILSVCCLVGFVIALFPSLQIPLGLLMLALLVATLIRDKKELCWNKRDNVRILLVVIATGIILGIFLIESREAIQLLNNTVYPGHRVSIGGDQGLEVLFTDPSVALTPFLTPGRQNACEISDFNQLGIFFLFVYFYFLWLKKKGKIRSSFSIENTLVMIMLIEMYFMFIGFPEIIAKITLFSYINRMYMIYGFTAMIFTFVMIAQVFQYRRLLSWRVGALACGLFILLYIATMWPNIDPEYRLYFGLRFYWSVALLMGFCGFLLFTQWRKLFFPIFGSWVVITGMLVNPIVQGADSVWNHDLIGYAEHVREEQPDARWLITNSKYTQQLLLANGIKVANGVNFYPDLKKWEILDPTHQNDTFYNRYAHIVINFTEEPTHYSLDGADSFIMYLNVDDFKKLDVEYVITDPMSADLLKNHGINAELVFEDPASNSFVYEIKKVG